MTKAPTISPQQALQLICDHRHEPLHCAVKREAARGRVLARDIYSQSNHPSFSRVCMDGIAVQYDPAMTRWMHQALQLAGDPPLQLKASDYAIEVATGAVCPTDCDLVIPYEHLERREGCWYLNDGQDVKKGSNIQWEGRELAKGQLLLRAGTVLAAPELFLLAAQGVAEVPVLAKPRIALISNGSELVRPDEIPESYQIRDANTLALQTLLADYGYAVECQELVADDEERLLAILQNVLETVDVVLISAGVSKGSKDLIPQILQELGVKSLIHGIEQRPGKPFYFGRLGEQRFVIGLPGNPVAALMNAGLYVLPLLSTLEGKKVRCYWRILSHDIPAQVRTSYFPISQVGEGSWRIMETLGSGDVVSLRGTEGFVIVPAGPEIKAGQPLRFIPWSFETCS